MGRPKGSKNKVQEVVPPAHVTEAGNPDFNLNDPAVLAHLEQQASTAITAEDLALDMELERMAMEEPIPDLEPALVTTLTKEKPSTEHLRDHMDGEYRMAQTLNELEHQITIAKRLGCDSIDADPKVIYLYCGKDYPRSLGFFMYKDIKVHFPNEYEGTKARLKQTIEQKIFGESKTK